MELHLLDLVVWLILSVFWIIFFYPSDENQNEKIVWWIIYVIATFIYSLIFIGFDVNIVDIFDNIEVVL